MEAIWKEPAFSPRRCFDARPTIVLKENGVREFYTRNVRDFEGFGFFRPIYPASA